jgi:hypothetical protein
MKEINFSFNKYNQMIINFSLERVIFVTDNGFDDLIKIAIKNYLK